MKKQSSLAIALMFALVAPLFGQNPATPPPQDDNEDVVRITTNLVQVDAVVTDKNGKQVTDLRADEFEIQENGEARQITNFSYVPLVAASTKLPAADPTAGADASPAPPPALRPEQVRRTLALVVDDLGLSFQSVTYVRRALKKFVDEQMQPGDLVAVIRTAGGVGALQQFTSDKRQLYAAIERIAWYRQGRGGISPYTPMEGRDLVTETRGGLPVKPEEGSSAVDAADELSEEFFTVGTLGAIDHIVNGLRNLPGRKSVMLLSDGIRIYSKDGRSLRILEALRRLTDRANRASVVIYTMDARGLQTLGLTAADNSRGLSRGEEQDGLVASPLEQNLQARREDFFETQSTLNYLARETGGISIRNTNDLSGGIKEMLDDQQGFYLLGYRPDEETFDPKQARFNKLTIKVKRPGLSVRYRSGFLGITDEAQRAADQPRTRAEQLMKAVTSPFAAGGIGLRLTSLFANDAKSGSYMKSFLHVDARDLTFKEEPDGWRSISFDVLAVTFGDNGTVVDEANRSHTIKVRGETYRRLMKDGLYYTITVPVKKPGAYQLRTALRDTATERVGSASQFITIPDIGNNRLMLSGIILNGLDPAKVKNHTAAGAAAATPTKDASAEADQQSAPAVRRLRRGMILEFGYVIYNARLDKSTNRPQLQTQIKLFRDGQQIFAGDVLPFDPLMQSDLKRLSVGGRLQLGTDMQPGDYVLQVIVTDPLADPNHRTATQWMDFQLQ